MHKTIVGGLFALTLLVPATANAQVRVDRWQVETPSAVAPAWTSASEASAPAVLSGARLDGHPWLRTLATLAASTAGYAIVDGMVEVEPGDSEVRYAPIAAGAGAGALAGLVFSNASPFRVIAGAALSALPAAALSTFLEGSMEDGTEGNVPLVAFSIPQGLLTSAFSQDRR